MQKDAPIHSVDIALPDPGVEVDGRYFLRCSPSSWAEGLEYWWPRGVGNHG